MLYTSGLYSGHGYCKIPLVSPCFSFIHIQNQDLDSQSAVFTRGRGQKMSLSPQYTPHISPEMGGGRPPHEPGSTRALIGGIPEIRIAIQNDIGIVKGSWRQRTTRASDGHNYLAVKKRHGQGQNYIWRYKSDMDMVKAVDGKLL